MQGKVHASTQGRWRDDSSWVWVSEGRRALRQVLPKVSDDVTASAAPDLLISQGKVTQLRQATT